MEELTPLADTNTEKPSLPPANRTETARKKVGSFRATQAEMALCQAKAKKQGKSLSAYALMAMLNRRDRRPCVPAINKEAHSSLGTATANLNQIAHVLNQQLMRQGAHCPNSWQDYSVVNREGSGSMN